MERKRIYIQAAEQISIQQPLSEQWMDDPQIYNEPLVKALNPSFREYMAPNEVRRMGNLMKRALVTTLKLLGETKTGHPEAIITGTSIGSLDYTEKFLDAMVENGEETLSPTYFMQSTHNTVGSTLAIYTKTHGYNSTYSHGSLSFELALLDAWMQMRLGKISTTLVGGHDEMVDSYFELLRKSEYVGLPGMVPCSEVAMSMLLNTDDNTDRLCEVAGIQICHQPSLENLKGMIGEMLEEADMKECDVSAVMIGVNGNKANDQYYLDIVDNLFPQMPLLHYKHLFGENYTVSALGLYAAAHCLKKERIPSFMWYDYHANRCDALRSILLINVMEGKDYSLILLKKI